MAHHCVHFRIQAHGLAGVRQTAGDTVGVVKPSFKRAFERAGVDTTRRPSEVIPALARDQIQHAAINCELQKARAEVRAKMIVEKFNRNGR